MYDEDRFKGVLAFIVAMYWTGATFYTGHKSIILNKDTNFVELLLSISSIQKIIHTVPEQRKNQCDS